MTKTKRTHTQWQVHLILKNLGFSPSNTFTTARGRLINRDNLSIHHPTVYARSQTAKLESVKDSSDGRTGPCISALSQVRDRGVCPRGTIPEEERQTSEMRRFEKKSTREAFEDRPIFFAKFLGSQENRVVGNVSSFEPLSVDPLIVD